MPILFCQIVIRSLILEPLDEFFPEKSSKVKIWTLCKDQMRLHLEELGYVLGIQEWIKSFNNDNDATIEEIKKQEMSTYENIAINEYDQNMTYTVYHCILGISGDTLTPVPDPDPGGVGSGPGLKKKNFLGLNRGWGF
ncbi:unnamed protein product, partial [Didymodactylos carnosus]